VALLPEPPGERTLSSFFVGAAKERGRAHGTVESRAHPTPIR
jgi:hypothetical protein